MHLGKRLRHKQYKNGLVRDGTPTHNDTSCKNNGTCPWCQNGKIYKNKRRMIDIYYD